MTDPAKRIISAKVLFDDAQVGCSISGYPRFNKLINKEELSPRKDSALCSNNSF